MDEQRIALQDKIEELNKGFEKQTSSDKKKRGKSKSDGFNQSTISNNGHTKRKSSKRDTE